MAKKSGKRGFSTSGRMTVKRMKDEFQQAFGVPCDIMVDGKSVDDNQTLASLRPEGYEGQKKTDFKVQGNMLVRNVKRRFEEVFGFQLVVFHLTEAPDDSTLASLRRKDESDISEDDDGTVDWEEEDTDDTGEMKEDKKMSESTNFSIDFDSIAPTSIEVNETEELLEEGDAFESEKTKIFEPEKAIETFRQNTSIQFDGDLDNPENFQRIRILGFSGPERCDAESATFGNFTIFGLADLSEDAEEEDQEEMLEDILHAIRIEFSNDYYLVDYGDWEEYSIDEEEPPDDIVKTESEWLPE
jgi:hypothetical protein